MTTTVASVNYFREMFQLNDKVAVLTAAGSGMGRSSALAYASAGAVVYSLDINESALDDLKQDSINLPGEVITVCVDATDDNKIESVLADVEREWGRIDVLHNHAGRPSTRGVSLSNDDWQKASDLNLRVPIRMTSMALELVRKASSPSLIYTSSIGGIRASKDSPLYGALKHGVIGYMRSVAAILGPENIRANAICPGPIETPMLVEFFDEAPGSSNATGRSDVDEAVANYSARVPLGRTGEPDDIGAVALFLASDASRYVTGVAIPVDGGISAT